METTNLKERSMTLTSTRTAQRKQCSSCKHQRSTKHFDRRKDGLQPYCKDCKRSYRQSHLKEEAQYQINYKHRNPDKIAAHTAVRSALKTGRLVKPKRCEACNKELPLESHHRDYSKPLEVEWHCTPCHKRDHRGA
jgi:hypothetical protein